MQVFLRRGPPDLFADMPPVDQLEVYCGQRLQTRVHEPQQNVSSVMFRFQVYSKIRVKRWYA